jgi:DNA invertase Pin-like site-specific DNA recombinase
MARNPLARNRCRLGSFESNQGETLSEFGYARVSTLDQSPDLQLDALAAAGVPRETTYTEHISGTKHDRPELSAVLAALQPGDRLTVWKLDRLGRSMSHLVRTIEDLGNRDVQFRSLQDPIDTSTANGRLMFGIFAAMAQFERELIQERTLAGLAAARSRGVQMGRPTKVNSEQVRLINQLAHDGTPHRRIALATGLSRAVVGRVLRGEIASLTRAQVPA